MLWIVIVAGFIAFVLSCAMGSNDVANSFGVLVGTKTLSLRWALVVASIFEFLGAMVMGDHVSGTLRTGIIVEGVFRPGEEQLYMIGMLCVILGPTLWLILSTYLSLPVSTTHAVVGGILGFVISLKGYNAIQWMSIGKIALSWVVSPLLGALASAPLYFIIKRFILKENAEKRTLIFFPFISALTVMLVFGSIFIEGSPALYLDRVPLAASIPSTIGFGIIVGIVCACCIPLIRKKLNKMTEKRHQDKLNSAMNATEEQSEKELEEKPLAAESQDSYVNLVEDASAVEPSTNEEMTNEDIKQDDVPPIVESNNDDQARVEPQQINEEDQKENADVIYKGLMIFCGALSSFSHGANDVSNAIAPFSAIYSVYEQGHLQIEEFVPIWILFLGSAGIVVGLATFGYKVILMVGSSLTKKQLVPAQGFVSQLCGASFVVIASKFGLPVSTTNALVGAVIGVGCVEDFSGVKWKLLGEVVAGWLTTLPISALLSAALFSFLKWTVI